MAKEFEDQDLRDAVFWGVHLGDARFRDVDLSGVTMHHVVLRDVTIDGVVDRVVINGVDVTELIHQNDPWQPLRRQLTPTTVGAALDALDDLAGAWNQLLEDPSVTAVRGVSVDGEWSLHQTLRHLVFVLDKWWTVPIGGGVFHPIGMPNSGSADHPWPGLDPKAEPSWEATRAVRAERASTVRAALAALTDTDLDRTVDVPENGPHRILDCVHTILEEEFEHHRYVVRDLATLEK